MENHENNICVCPIDKSGKTEDIWQYGNIISLWDMLFRYSSAFIWLIEFIRTIEKSWIEPEQNPENAKEFYVGLINRAQGYLDLIDLPFSNMQCEKIIDYINGDQFGNNNPKFKNMLQELVERIKDELVDRQFFYVRSEFVDYYNKIPFSPITIGTFPEAMDDMEEAGKCYALERPTACAFHVSRIMEHGLRRIVKSIAGEDKFYPNWGAILAEIQKYIDNLPDKDSNKRSKYLYIKERFQLMKDVWRNPTIHVERIYNQEQAKEILDTCSKVMDSVVAVISE